MDGVPMAYDVYEPDGEARPEECPIILIHGQSWNKYVYRHVARSLCNSTGIKVIAIDARNHGDTAHYEQISLELAIKDMVLFMTNMDIQKASFVSHSYSSLLAYRLALERPDLVHKIVLVDHLPYEAKLEFLNKVLMKYVGYQNQLLRLLKSDMSLDEAKHRIMSCAPVDQKGVVALHEKIAYDLVKKDGTFTWKHPLYNQYPPALYDWNRQCRQPSGMYYGEILLIRGEKSEFVIEADFEKAKSYNPNMKFVTIKDSTHLLMFEKTEEFIKEVKEFLCGTSVEM